MPPRQPKTKVHAKQEATDNGDARTPTVVATSTPVEAEAPTPALATSPAPAAAAPPGAMPAQFRTRGRPRASGQSAIEWTDAMTEKLIELWFVPPPTAEDASSSPRRKTSWVDIARQLREQLGIHVEHTQCKNKVKTMLPRWSQYVANPASVDLAFEPTWMQLLAQRSSAVLGDNSLAAIASDATTAASVSMPAAGAHSESSEVLQPAKRRRLSNDRDQQRWNLELTALLFQLRYETLRASFDSPQKKQQQAAWVALAQEISMKSGMPIDVEKCQSKIKMTKLRWKRHKTALTAAQNQNQNQKQHELMPATRQDPKWIAIVDRYCGNEHNEHLNDKNDSSIDSMHEQENDDDEDEPVAAAASSSAPIAEATSANTHNHTERRPLSTNQATAMTHLLHANVENEGDVTTPLPTTAAVLTELVHAIRDQSARMDAQTASIQDLVALLRDERRERLL